MSVEKLLNRLKETSNNVTRALAIADQETIDNRLKVCDGCEFLHPVTKQCKQCGCLTIAKARLKNQKCPIGKW
jgi:hypothetical protein